MKIKDIVRLSIVCALYVVLTLVFNFISYGNIQFRVAEILVLLCFFRRDYIIPVVLGCVISNLISPMGLIDCLFGGVATLASCVLISYMHNIFISVIFPVVINGLAIGYELFYVTDLPFLYSTITVAIGEFVVLLIGAFLFNHLKKNRNFMELINAKQNYILEE